MNVYDALAEAWPEIGRGYKRNACILASRAGTLALEYFGVESEAMPMKCIAFNRLALEFFEHKVPVQLWPDAAWSVGMAPSQGGDASGYEGHVVIVASDDTIIDLTVMQMSRPHKALVIERPLIITTDNGVVKGNELWVEHDGIPICYSPFVDESFERVPDWKINGPKAAGPLIRRMRDILSS